MQYNKLFWCDILPHIKTNKIYELTKNRSLTKHVFNDNIFVPIWIIILQRFDLTIRKILPRYSCVKFLEAHTLSKRSLKAHQLQLLFVDFYKHFHNVYDTHTIRKRIKNIFLNKKIVKLNYGLSNSEICKLPHCRFASHKSTKQNVYYLKTFVDLYTCNQTVDLAKLQIVASKKKQMDDTDNCDMLLLYDYHFNRTLSFYNKHTLYFMFYVLESCSTACIMKNNLLWIEMLLNNAIDKDIRECLIHYMNNKDSIDSKTQQSLIQFGYSIEVFKMRAYYVAKQLILLIQNKTKQKSHILFIHLLETMKLSFVSPNTQVNHKNNYFVNMLRHHNKKNLQLEIETDALGFVDWEDVYENERQLMQTTQHSEQINYKMFNSNLLIDYVFVHNRCELSPSSGCEQDHFCIIND